MCGRMSGRLNEKESNEWIQMESNSRTGVMLGGGIFLSILFFGCISSHTSCTPYGPNPYGVFILPVLYHSWYQRVQKSLRRRPKIPIYDYRKSVGKSEDSRLLGKARIKHHPRSVSKNEETNPLSLEEKLL